MPKLRYTIVRGYYTERPLIGRIVSSESIDCKTKQEAVDLGSILTQEEKFMSYIFDNVTQKKMTLKGEY